jgi:hypothetical protein
MKIYFAHPISIYNTHKENALLYIIKEAFSSDDIILNPGDINHQLAYAIKGDMSYFTDLVKECDAIVAYPFEDGYFGAGVSEEWKTAQMLGLHSFIIDPSTFSITKTFFL